MFHHLVRYVLDRSLLLLIGTAGALVWANVDLASYVRIADALHFIVNDIGMVFFFALAAKEVFEATLPGGALASPRQAAVPLLAALGGMAVPAALYLGMVTAAGQPDLARGWAIPCATDIAFSALAARVIFPASHPAVPFLLLLAIADDALGLIILAVFYPTSSISLVWLMVFLIPAVIICEWFRRSGVRSFWPYVLIGGALAWLGLHEGGFHPSLALVPIVPFMPHRLRDIGLFAPEEEHGHDTLSHFEHAFHTPVQIVLFLFGFANAGVPFAQVGIGTWIVVLALVAGKPLGILGFTYVAEVVGFRRPRGLAWADVLVLGTLAGIGFTVALFFATAAFPPGSLLDQTKMGALLSFFAAPMAIALARTLKS